MTIIQCLNILAKADDVRDEHRNTGWSTAGLVTPYRHSTHVQRFFEHPTASKDDQAVEDRRVMGRLRSPSTPTLYQPHVRDLVSNNIQEHRPVWVPGFTKHL